MLADRTGFCFGVKRAVQMAEDALKTNRPIYSLGSIIHNKQVVRGLSGKGLKVIKDYRGIKGGTVVISSHGLSPKKSVEMASRGIKIIDTTCPFVQKAQGTARDLSEEGYIVVIVGDVNHPEVKALVDFVKGRFYIVRNKAEARKLNLKKKDRVSVISQTTQSIANFSEVVKAISQKRPKEIKVFNTICRDAEERQRLAKGLASDVDLMLVIGGHDSANTRRLLDVCKRISTRCRLIETEKELKQSWFKEAGRIGITSGASTPDWVIKRVVDRINEKLKRKGLCD